MCQATVINCFTALRCSKGGFLGGATSLFSHNHSKFSAWYESNTTSVVIRMFWSRQDGHQF